MTIKRFGYLLLCLVAMLALSACSKPFGNTPYELGEPYESSDVQDDNTRNDIGDLMFGEDSVPDNSNSTGSSKPTGNSNSSDDSSTDSNGADVNWGDDSSGSTTSTTKKAPATSTTTRPIELEEIGGIRLPAEGYSPDDKLQIGTVELNGDTVTMEIKNITPNEYFSAKETDQTSYVEYICYDKDGKELRRDKLRFGRIHKQESRTCEFTIPTGTVEVVLGEFVVEYWSNGFV